ncbi:hypothetical protein H9Q16_04120 [Sulfitobacter sp. TSTF-M16]|uniref:Uncharacterized protein n=1 Tax=Sulfitobacter aestuariivivens TaxID=2766981 RepID=A0A927HE79_9RHOB|nr:hypothetical protein [Sulfitobacter aestuariivivens]
MSVIDWLGQQKPPQGDRANPNPNEPPVARTGTAPAVLTTPLAEGSPREIGIVPPSVTGLPTDLWVGSDPDTLIARIANLPEMTLPAAQSLLYTVLLADALAPQGKAVAGDALALARVDKLVQLGALDPALSLIEQAGVTTSPDHFDQWMRISLLTGTEDRACAVLAASPHLTRDYGARILCSARGGEWENAALTFGSAQALGLMPEYRLDLLDRFLNPDLYEEAAPLAVPRKMDPLSFRLFEAIGERLPTGALPRPYAVADLRDLAGWKAQLEAAERLTRAGALPDNHLLGLYTDRKPAASGGIWDRVATLQRFDTALKTDSAEAVAKTLPAVWDAMRDADLETAFASLFAERLAEIPLEGPAARTAFEIGLLSPRYEATAAAAPDDPQTALLRAVAFGDASTTRPQTPVAAAIFDAFKDAPPLSDLVEKARTKRLGEAVLHLLDLLEDGAQGDANALRDALATLRALGLEDTARRAALQILLLDV